MTCHKVQVLEHRSPSHRLSHISSKNLGPYVRRDLLDIGSISFPMFYDYDLVVARHYRYRIGPSWWVVMILLSSHNYLNLRICVCSPIIGHVMHIKKDHINYQAVWQKPIASSERFDLRDRRACSPSGIRWSLQAALMSCALFSLPLISTKQSDMLTCLSPLHDL